MAISIDHATYVITIPKADTTFVETNATTGYEIRSYDEYALMRELADYLDSEAGVALPNAFTHATQVTISGIVYARSLLFLAPYTITFENDDYQVQLLGGTNNNMLDVLNPNNVSVIPANSAGLQTVVSGSGVTAGDKTDIIDGVWSKALETLTAEEMMRVMLAALAGKVNGAGTGTENFRDQADTKNRITSTVDGSGNRSNVVVDGT